MPKKVYSYSASYESDTQPVETVRGTLEASGGPQAIRQGSREACRAWPKGRPFRSIVVVVELQEGQES